MRNDHIINLIEERPLSNLSATEIEWINAHTANCAECLLAFEAARASSRLLQERASVTVEPSPFFQTRVLAAIRERNSASEMFGFQKMWQTARVLIASMAVVVVMLTALTFLANREQAPTSNGDVALSAVLGDDTLANDDMTDSQVFTNLYDQEAEGADGRQQ